MHHKDGGVAPAGMGKLMSCSPSVVKIREIWEFPRMATSMIWSSPRLVTRACTRRVAGPAGDALGPSTRKAAAPELA
nr:hypothetical protein [uncultured bacterium]